MINQIHFNTLGGVLYLGRGEAYNRMYVFLFTGRWAYSCWGLIRGGAYKWH